MGASASAPAAAAEGLSKSASVAVLARTPTARRSGFRLITAGSSSGLAPSTLSSSPLPPPPPGATPTDAADLPFIEQCLLSLLLFTGPQGPAAAAAAARSTYVISLKAGDILAREGDSSASTSCFPLLAPSSSSGALAALGAAAAAPAPAAPAATSSTTAAATELYIVKSGTLEVIESRGGSAVRVDLKRRGDCVGEVRFSFSCPSSFFVFFLSPRFPPFSPSETKPDRARLRRAALLDAGRDVRRHRGVVPKQGGVPARSEVPFLGCFAFGGDGGGACSSHTHQRGQLRRQPPPKGNDNSVSYLFLFFVSACAGG